MKLTESEKLHTFKVIVGIAKVVPDVIEFAGEKTT